jgi:CDGSH-type Zn-finger protein
MSAPQRPVRVTMTEGGPFLVEGPVELELPDGSTVRSDRPVVALCACRRTRRYPFCDTSHRRKLRPSRDQAADGSGADRSADRPAAQEPTT